MKISPNEYIHPEDKAALDNLMTIPLLPACVKAFIKLYPEHFLYGMNMAQKIRLGPEQLTEIYGFLPPICESLGIGEPEFYLEMSPVPNAYTYGDTRIFLTVTSGLIEYLEKEEIRAVLAHECGHIACHHVLYHTMANILINYGAQVFGPLALAYKPVILALLYWQRRSELSADRAAVVVMEDHQPVVDTMIRLAGGPKSITGKVNIELYIKQAEAYDKLIDESIWDRILQGVAIMNADHPFLAVRTREIMKWSQSDHMQRILKCIREDETAPKCPVCGKALKENWKFCRSCGTKIQ
ncbi:MAG: heat shock protein HtpX [Pelotomaculum sp. PtaU1.Bin035]|nr:MAG: heat shock protein HtpX [Pelotomaculum sp. PtaU1.Bin035]